MKKLLLALAFTGMLAGCASNEHSEGGSSDGYNNATRGTGTSTATNEYWNATGDTTNQDSSTMPNP